MDKRWVEHCRASNRNKTNNYFYNALQLYGFENWTHEVLVEGIDTYEEAIALEKYYIKYYDTFENGYNTTLGGEGVFGYKYSQEEREAMKTERRNRKGNKLYSFYNPNLDIVEKNIHVMDMSDKYSILPGNLWYVVNGKSKQANGWFLLKEEDGVYSSHGVHIISHPEYGDATGTVTELSNLLGLQKRSLRRVITGERKSLKGWMLKEKHIEKTKGEIE